MSVHAALRGLWGRIVAYAHHDDPLAATCNLIALVVASNQPIYPLYVYLLVSEHIAPTYFTFLSTPFFVAVPALARRSPLWGRALLPAAGLGNTLLSARMFGLDSGVVIFLVPCALIAATFFRASERIVSFALIGAALLIYVAIGDMTGAPWHLYSPSEFAAFARLNAMSAGTLTVFVGLLASGLISEAPSTMRKSG